jgi:predicted dienelactone hydrolase
MKRALFVWLLLCGMANAATYRVATHDEVFQAGTRQLTSRIYYPTSAAGAPQWVGENPVFTGIESQPDAPVAKGRFPLIVISHGSGRRCCSRLKTPPR